MRAIVVVVLGLFCLSAEASAAPIEAYGTLPSLSDLALSPDGGKLAYATGGAANRQVVVLSLADNTVLGGLNLGDQKLRAIAWADDTHLLLTASKTGRAEDIISPVEEWQLTDVYDVVNHTQKNLLEYGRALNVTFGVPQARTVNGDTVVYVEGQYFPGQRGTPALFAVDLTTKQTSLVVQGSHDARGWVIDQAGNVVAEQDYDEGSRHFSLKIKQKDGWHEIYGADTPIDVPALLGQDSDGGILVQTVTGNGFEQRAFSPEDGSPMTVQSPGPGVGSPVYDPVTHRIIGAMRVGTGIDYVFFSADDKARWKRIADAFLGEQVELISSSADKSKLVVRVTGTRDGDAYELVDLATLQTRPLGREYQDIHADDIAPVSAISYDAADGMHIPAYLTLPKGREAKNLPLVVLAHGGPASRDMPGFDWWSQALASRGYAVLQPQFRGSEGFGPAFLSAGFGQWGRKMQTDLSDGVRYLSSRGTIDAKRVCIVGWSYGGYAAMAGPTLDPGVYRCAVAGAGISDPQAFVKWRAERTWTGEDNRQTRYWDRFMGTSSTDDPAFDQIAPIKHIDKVAVPILLIHGKDDTVVPLAQSEDFYDALHRANKDVQFVKLDGEDHWLSRPETRTEMLEATAAFLEKNNPP